MPTNLLMPLHSQSHSHMTADRTFINFYTQKLYSEFSFSQIKLRISVLFFAQARAIARLWVKKNCYGKFIF